MKIPHGRGACDSRSPLPSKGRGKVPLAMVQGPRCDPLDVAQPSERDGHGMDLHFCVNRPADEPSRDYVALSVSISRRSGARQDRGHHVGKRVGPSVLPLQGSLQTPSPPGR